MKKIITMGLMLATAFALTSCSKEFVHQMVTPEADYVAGVVPFEIYAPAVQTKTANDGMSTVWVENDQINVFHAEAGSTEYISDGNFTIYEAELTAGLFKGTLSESLTAPAYDWYFFYPYSNYVKTPASRTSGYMTLGSKSNAVQTQKGNSNMAHIAGENYPMCAVVKNVAAGETPAGQMKHMAALVAINVQNKTSKPMTVVSAGIRANESLVGTYYLDFTGEEVVYTPSGDQYVSDTANLEVVDGEEIAAGSSAKFYIAVKPFTAEAGSRITIYVNGSQKTISIPETTEFEAGKIKTINVPVVKMKNSLKTSEYIQENHFETGDNTDPFHSATINGVSTSSVVVMGTEDEAGEVFLWGYVEDFVNMTELGFFASSWTGKQGAVAVDNVVLYIPDDLIGLVRLASLFVKHPVLDYFADNSNPYVFTPTELAEILGVEVDMDRFIFKPAPAGVFVEGSTSHNLTILDEELHYYGVTEEDVDALLSGTGLGMSVADIRAIINGEGDIAAIIKDMGLWSKIQPMLGGMFTFDEFVEMAANVLEYFVQTEVTVTLKTVTEDQAGNTYDPRVVIWGMNIYFE